MNLDELLEWWKRQEEMTRRDGVPVLARPLNRGLGYMMDVLSGAPQRPMMPPAPQFPAQNYVNPMMPTNLPPARPPFPGPSGIRG